MSAELRDFHLRGALGAPTTTTYQGREHLVVPVVALMDGVIHAVNAATPERVRVETLLKAAPSWNGRPLVLGHPTKNGRQCSANEPGIESTHHFGTIFNSRVVGPKLLMDAYVDPVRAEKVGGPDFVKKLRNGEQIEVSVGAFVQTTPEEGVFNGRPYKAAWLETYGDHLAFLPGGRGACSIDMGCGAHRAAMHFVAAEGIQPVCEVCDGMGQVKDESTQKQHDCPACGGTGTLSTRTAEDITMTKEAAIKSLTSCPCSGFLPEDVKVLEGFSEARLTAMAAFAIKAKDDKDATDKQVADAKADKDKAEEEVKALRAAADKQPTEEEYLAKAPASIRALVAEKKAQDEEQKTSLVTQLKTAAAGAYTEDELKALSLPELVKLAKVAKIETPDYSGRAVPVVRTAAGAEQYTPPDPYAAAIAARSKAVN